MGVLGKIREINPLHKSRGRGEWLLYFVAVPTLLCLVFLLPDSAKRHLILTLESPDGSKPSTDLLPLLLR
jgi:hypothetical protein